jgi:hypothetical protein
MYTYLFVTMLPCRVLERYPTNGKLLNIWGLLNIVVQPP